MSIDTAEFRRVLGHFVTGVTVVTARAPETDEPVGLTVNAVASVSLDPALVLVCVERDAVSHDPIRDAGTFTINVLDAEQESLSRRFSADDATPSDKFRGVGWKAAAGGPVLEDALAWLDCRLWAHYPGGDHSIFVGEVLQGDAREGTPLLYYRGGYG
ncbi:MAG: flavin reductase family protein, partial [Longimicrobiales bacterium]